MWAGKRRQCCVMCSLFVHRASINLMLRQKIYFAKFNEFISEPLANVALSFFFNVRHQSASSRFVPAPDASVGKRVGSKSRLSDGTSRGWFPICAPVWLLHACNDFLTKAVKCCLVVGGVGANKYVFSFAKSKRQK